MYPDTMFTGFVDARSGPICIGDLVAIFALGPTGLVRRPAKLNADQLTRAARTVVRWHAGRAPLQARPDRNHLRCCSRRSATAY